MAKTAWPTTAELTNRLTGLGVTSIPTGVTLQDEIDKAVEMLERESHQSPFLAESTAADFKYDPTRSNIVDLRGEWFTIVSVTVDGTALTVNEDFWLRPFNGPYTSIEFNTVQFGDPFTIVVNGKRGVGSNIPLRAWGAVLDYAAGGVYRTASNAGTVATGSVKRIKQDSVEVEYAGGSSAMRQDTASILQDEAIGVFRSFRKLGVGNY